MSRRRKDQRHGGAVAVAAVVLVCAAAGTGWWLAARGQSVSPAGAKPPAMRPHAPTPAVEPLLTQPAEARPSPPVPHRAAPETPGQPVRTAATPAIRVAIIFDDAGGSLAVVEEIIAIGRPVAVAILPGLTHSAEIARRARVAGLEVLLHLPVESEDNARELGPGGVTVAMTDAEIHAAVRSGLASVPGAAGVNNHMGSRGTADRRVMRAVLEVARDAGLFFIDSRTTSETVGEIVAAELGVRTAARAVFLDNENAEDAIRQQIRRLIAVARERGSAIAIGHAQRLTPRVLAGMLDELDRAGIAIVPPSVLVR